MGVWAGATRPPKPLAPPGAHFLQSPRPRRGGGAGGGGSYRARDRRPRKYYMVSADLRLPEEMAERMRLAGVELRLAGDALTHGDAEQ